MNGNRMFWLTGVLVFAVLGILVWGSMRNAPEDMVFIGDYGIEAGRQVYEVEVEDPNGNYASNQLLIKFGGNVQKFKVNGLTVSESDPNYHVVDNAIPDPFLQYDPNNPEHVADPNIINRLSGSFSIGKNWKPGQHEISITVADSRGNSDTKWLRLRVADRTPPRVKKVISKGIKN